jgi:hypothetical protein
VHSGAPGTGKGFKQSPAPGCPFRAPWRLFLPGTWMQAASARRNRVIQNVGPASAGLLFRATPLGNRDAHHVGHFRVCCSFRISICGGSGVPVAGRFLVASRLFLHHGGVGDFLDSDLVGMLPEGLGEDDRSRARTINSRYEEVASCFRARSRRWARARPPRTRACTHKSLCPAIGG